MAASATVRDAARPSGTTCSACETAVLQASGIVDAFGYFWHNPDLPWYLCGHDEEVRHFARHGWKELRNPHPGFDLWFYWCRYLDPTREDVNPAIHYLLEGRRRGFETKPAITARPEPDALEAGRSPRRVCLFAGYDVDGLVDETVVAYLRDLSRFADIYYLADCPLEPGELDKLAPYTKGRWAIRHGRYDFGSYSMLAEDLVGWDVDRAATTSWCWPTTAATSCSPSTGSSRGWTPSRRTGGASRRRTRSSPPTRVRARAAGRSGSTTSRT